MSLPSSPTPPYRARYLAAMTPAQIAALPDKAWAPVIINTGAIEQHGRHLPVAVDSVLGQAWITLVLEHLPPGASCYVAPAITVGKSNEHTGFPGTLMISKGTLRQLLLAIARQIHAWGFKTLLIINTHGGNIAVVQYTLREIKATLGLRAETVNSKVELDISLQEKKFGYHANEAETALLLALAPQTVRMERAVCEYCGRIDDPGELRPEQGVATRSWVSQDLSKSGVMGDATLGTAEKGQRWFEVSTRGLAAEIGRICREMKSKAG
jgi:creatinine amidohydrolase